MGYRKDIRDKKDYRDKKDNRDRKEDRKREKSEKDRRRAEKKEKCRERRSIDNDRESDKEWGKPHIKLKIVPEERGVVPPLRIKTENNEKPKLGLKLTLKKSTGSGSYYSVGE